MKHPRLASILTILRFWLVAAVYFTRRRDFQQIQGGQQIGFWVWISFLKNNLLTSLNLRETCFIMQRVFQS